MATYSGRYCSVKLGTSLVVGVGEYSIDGVTIDRVDTTAFGSVWKTFDVGMSDGGQITFNGYYDASDSTGQQVLIAANHNGTAVTNIRFYIDNTSYYTPATTNPYSYCLIESYQITANKGDICRVKFTAKVSGRMQLI